MSRNIFPFILGLGLLGACTDNPLDTNVVKRKKINSMGTSYAFAAADNMPDCITERENQLIYIESTAEFLVCRSLVWTKVNIGVPTAGSGTAGVAGAAGAAGVAGAKGDKGDATEAVLADNIIKTTHIEAGAVTNAKLTLASPLGIDTTAPKAALQFASAGGLSTYNDLNLGLGFNAWYDGGNAMWKRIAAANFAVLLDLKAEGTNSFAFKRATDAGNTVDSALTLGQILGGGATGVTIGPDAGNTNSQLTVNVGAVANAGLRVNGIATQTANLIEANTNGTSMMTLGPTGNVVFTGYGKFLTIASAPVAGECVIGVTANYGRMYVDPTSGTALLWICTAGGWSSVVIP